MIELLVDVLARIEHAPAFVVIPLAGHEAALRSGDVDSLAFKAVIPEFAEVYDQSAPVVITGAAWFGPRGNDGAERPHRPARGSSRREAGRWSGC